jgi:outer membrane biosynthesis protein TonB
LKISEKAALAMAGYTKAEIEAMEHPSPQPAPQPVPQPAPQPVPQPAPQPVPQPAAQYDGLETLLHQILQGQQTMTQTLQANALGLGIQQQPTADAATVTARIIDPTYGTEVK